MKYYFYKDKFLPLDQPAISVVDRSFRFGDGIFDTLMVDDGKMYDFSSHIERLAKGLKTFKITLDISTIEPVCRNIINKNKLRAGYVRIIISRGENTPDGLGYLPGNTAPYFVVETVEKPFPTFHSLNLFVSSHKVYYPVPCKTNSSMHYTISMIEANENGCENALITDINGHICETGSGNIFWVKGKTIYTPSLDLPIVPGTIRNKLLQLWPEEIIEGHFTLGDLQNADEIFMTNIGCLSASINEIKPLNICLENSKKALEIYKLLKDDIKTHISLSKD